MREEGADGEVDGRVRGGGDRICGVFGVGSGDGHTGGGCEGVGRVRFEAGEAC